jgi:hypothetical protein
MNSTVTPHPDPELLLRLLDGDLSLDEKETVAGHLASCGPCRQELDEVREALTDYQHFHDQVLKPAIPPPPKPWQRLNVLAGHPEQAPRERVVRLTSWRWFAAAAAVIAAILVVRRMDHTPQVSAAELLRKAVVAEQAAPARKHSIHIRSRRYQLDRPARLPKDSHPASRDADGLRQLLESAGYGWENPLSAEAYQRWHDSLADKHDQVQSSSPPYVVRTTSGTNTISNASLTLGTDLHPVACTLQFGATDTVELSEIQDADQPAPLHPATDPERHPALPITPAVPAGPAEELQVMVALHRIGADLGEPIDVRREGGSVLVNVTGLTAARQSDVKAALSGLPSVKLQFAELSHREDNQQPRRPAPQVDTANPLFSELQDKLQNGVTLADVEEQLTDSTENLIARAYALRSLARRFPSATIAHWTAADNLELNGLVQDHARAMATCTQTVERLLKPLLPPVSASPAANSTWDELAQAVLAESRRLDEALNAPTGGDASARKAAIARALSDLDLRLTRLRTLIQP